ncbi:hypothetical protein [uncultured Pelagimonas sp.]|uniref:hypothetical protein n=1 Tax=uncultured Pelagimonas sp. TaxID=1618102 RepID=UPI002614B9F7|nr:hypothetical protein [uncultured Pelagimonas sp.]
MTHHSEKTKSWAQATNGLPGPIDCETQALLRLFLGPILETAPNWSEIDTRLSEKGYGLCFREGRLVILNENGEAICTGRGLGIPLAEIANRIGRPSIKMHPDGHSGELG